MIRPFTVLCLLAACGSGLYLYSEKHRTELLERDIGRVIHATEAARARTGLLRAEWALLNEPGRLQDMAGRYLTLHPMIPVQFVQLAELSTHLPAPVAMPPDGAVDDDDATPAPVLTVASVAVTPPMVPPITLPAKHPMMTAKLDPRPGAKLLAGARGHAQHHVLLADRDDMTGHDSLLARSTPLPLAAPLPMGASVYNAMARPTPMVGRSGPGRPAIVAAVPSFAAGRPLVQSALGGGTSLPPPIPYGR